MEIKELYTTDNNLLDEEIISEENLEVLPEPEPVSSVNDENITPAPSNTIITQYFNLASYDAYQEYEHILKQIGYIALITLCVLVAIGYLYAKPGTGMRLKWRRSVRKLTRLSKNLLPSIKYSSSSVFPVVKDVVSVAHVVLNQIFE